MRKKVTTSMARSSFLSTLVFNVRMLFSLKVCKILKLEVILSVSELLIVQESTEKAVHKRTTTHCKLRRVATVCSEGSVEVRSPT